MALVYASKDKGCTLDIVFQDASGVTITPVAADEIRILIGWAGQIESDLSGSELTVASDAPTAAGSTFTKNSPNSGTQRLRLDASDLNFAAGVYTMLVELNDSKDADDWKLVDRYVFVLEATQ